MVFGLLTYMYIVIIKCCYNCIFLRKATPKTATARKFNDRYTKNPVVVDIIHDKTDRLLNPTCACAQPAM